MAEESSFKIIFYEISRSSMILQIGTIYFFCHNRYIPIFVEYEKTKLATLIIFVEYEKTKLTTLIIVLLAYSFIKCQATEMFRCFYLNDPVCILIICLFTFYIELLLPKLQMQLINHKNKILSNLKKLM